MAKTSEREGGIKDDSEINVNVGNWLINEKPRHLATLPKVDSSGPGMLYRSRLTIDLTASQS